MREYHQGHYEVRNPEKYIGTRKPRFLSSWEYDVFRFMDLNPNILKWGSEVVVVKYWNPVKERKARYLVDIFCQYKNRKGELVIELIEVKPYKETKKPVRQGRKKASTFKQEEITWVTNCAKWEAAKQYAEERGWRWRILTEYEIYL